VIQLKVILKPNSFTAVLNYALRDPVLHAFTIHDIRNEPDVTDVIACIMDDGVIGYALAYLGLLKSGARTRIAAILYTDNIDVVPELVKWLCSKYREHEILLSAPYYLRDVIQSNVAVESVTPFYIMKLEKGREKLILDVEYRKLRPEEIDELISRHPGDEFIRSRAPLLKKSRYTYGIVVDDRVVGVGTAYVAEPEIWLIGSIWVAPEYRGRGLGKRITSVMVKVALEHTSTVALWVEKGNERAIRAYRSVGFEIIDEWAWYGIREGRVLH